MHRLINVVNDISESISPLRGAGKMKSCVEYDFELIQANLWLLETKEHDVPFLLSYVL
jgi:hypothetical protein